MDPRPAISQCFRWDELALWFLAELSRKHSATFTRTVAIDRALKSVGDRLPGDKTYRLAGRPAETPPLAQALAEAWGWLLGDGLIAEAATALLAGQMPVAGYFFITRYGQRVLRHPRPLAWLAAERRLAIELHPPLEERARRQFVLGEFEAAALIAMREVELAVRAAARLPDDLYGTPLMNRDFADDGPLSDPAASKAELESRRALDRGAVGLFKNPASHRELRYEDPVLAAEVVLFADLLLRMLGGDGAPLGPAAER